MKPDRPSDSRTLFDAILDLRDQKEVERLATISSEIRSGVYQLSDDERAYLAGLADLAGPDRERGIQSLKSLASSEIDFYRAISEAADELIAARGADPKVQEGGPDA